MNIFIKLRDRFLDALGVKVANSEPQPGIQQVANAAAIGAVFDQDVRNQVAAGIEARRNPHRVTIENNAAMLGAAPSRPTSNFAYLRDGAAFQQPRD